MAKKQTATAKKESKRDQIEREIDAAQAGRMIRVIRPSGACAVVVALLTFRADQAASILARHPTWSYSFVPIPAWRATK